MGFERRRDGLRLGRLQRWLGRAAAVLVANWDAQRRRFHVRLPPVILVSHDTLACCWRQPIEVPGAGPSEQKSRSGLPLIDAPRLRIAVRAKNTEQVSPAAAAAQRHCWMRHVCWALLCLLTTTMALLKPPTPGECFCGKTRISLIDADAIVSSSICHCSVCRRLCGAPFCANLLTPRSNVRIDIYGSPASVDALAGLQTSKNVVRYRCTSCSSPTLATLKLGKQDLYALPLAAFPRPHPRVGAAAPAIIRIECGRARRPKYRGATCSATSATTRGSLCRRAGCLVLGRRALGNCIEFDGMARR